MLKYDVMNVIFVSFRGIGKEGQQANRIQDTMNITVPSDLILRQISEGVILQVQISPVPYIRHDSTRPFSRPDSGRPTRPASRPNPGRDRPISPFTGWSSIVELPTRLDLEEEEVIAINSDNDSDYVPPETVYEPGSPRPDTRGPREEESEEPSPGPLREEGPVAPNIFTDSARGRGRGRGIPGIPVQCVAPFFRGSGSRRNFLGRVRPVVTNVNIIEDYESYGYI